MTVRAGLLGDAAGFPPGNAPLGEAGADPAGLGLPAAPAAESMAR